MTKKIDMMSPANGRMRGEDDSVINVADEMKGINEKLGAGANLGGAPISETNPVPVTSTDAKTKILTVTIAAGANASEVINVDDYNFYAFRVVGTWTPADLYYNSSAAANGVMSPVIESGVEVHDPVAAGSWVSIAANALALAPLSFLQICSGPSTLRVAQINTITIEVQLKR